MVSERLEDILLHSIIIKSARNKGHISELQYQTYMKEITNQKETLQQIKQQQKETMKKIIEEINKELLSMNGTGNDYC